MRNQRGTRLVRRMTLFRTSGRRGTACTSLLSLVSKWCATFSEGLCSRGGREKYPETRPEQQGRWGVLMSLGLHREVQGERPWPQAPGPPQTQAAASSPVAGAVSHLGAPVGLSPSGAWPPGRPVLACPSVRIPAAAAASFEAARTATTAPGLPLPGRADRQGPPPHVPPVQGGDGTPFAYK